jgi:hypothetical protein
MVLLLVLVLPMLSVASIADAPPSILIYVSNQVAIDYSGTVSISTMISILNNGTTASGPLIMNMTYGGALTPYVSKMTSSSNVTSVQTGASSTTYFFNLDNITAGNSSQISFSLTLVGMARELTPGVKTYNLTNFPDVQILGGLLANASSTIILPQGANVTSDFTKFGYSQTAPGVPQYFLLFTNNTVPQTSAIPVSFAIPDILYSTDNKVSIDNFGWVYLDTVVTVNNTAPSDSGTLPLNMTFSGLFMPYTWNMSSSSPVTGVQTSSNTTSYNFNIPSIAADGSSQFLFHLKMWGTMNEFSPGTYTYNLTTFPVVDIQGGTLFNATSTISLPSGTTVSSALTQFGFVQQPPSNPTYEQLFTSYSVPTPSIILVNFTATTAQFALFQILSLERTISMAGDGSVLVTDILSINNTDTQDISSMNLTFPTSGQYHLREGYVDGGTVDLSTGTASLPVPISANSLQTLIIQYELIPSAVTDKAGTLTIIVGSSALAYADLVQSYSVVLSFPSGTVAQASTPLSFVNQTSMPIVVLTAKVPVGWNLYLATPAIVGLLIAAVLVFFLYRRTDLEPFEEDGISIVQAKSDVITSLLEQYRLRGEGFSPFDEYSAKRRALEEEKSKVAARLQDYKGRSLKDRAQKSFYDKMAVEDARLEQLYREGKASLEECLANRLSQKDFEAKTEKLKSAAIPTDLLKKSEPKQGQAKPAKQ